MNKERITQPIYLSLEDQQRAEDIDNRMVRDHRFRVINACKLLLRDVPLEYSTKQDLATIIRELEFLTK